ncbi:protein REVEILLE 6 isoform X1 [Nicotiana sylvestris]|uniref:Protein REVEILLE 6 isoform X1 n=1 Tax=Nicotiana sylvestris TaxID=4096 RepID=A0A1U7WPT5_NICSY|nr:PREDICTED: protein REVEILLE 6 isoform X1 [Nicotiana sylvestris]
MVSVYPTPPAGQDFYYIGDPTKMGLPGLHPIQSGSNGAGTLGNLNSSTGSVVPDDHNKKTRKPYTITKSRESWTEQEHDKFLEALQLFDRDWKKIEAFVGSKTVIQIRSHAQKYFLKVQKSGTSEHVPPPRPKRKAAHPYPQKAPKKVLSQVGSIQFQPPGALPEPGFGIGPDSLAVPGNTINFSPWTYDNVPAISTTHMRKDDAQLSSGGVVQNCSSSSNESMPRICTTKESNAQKESKKQMKDSIWGLLHDMQYQRYHNHVMPDFAQVYRFIGSVFDPSTRDHLQRLKKMDPIDVQTALMLMKNLSFNLLSPEFEDHRRLLSSYGLGAEKDKMDHPIKTDFRENAIRAV